MELTVQKKPILFYATVQHLIAGFDFFRKAFVELVHLPHLYTAQIFSFFNRIMCAYRYLSLF